MSLASQLEEMMDFRYHDWRRMRDENEELREENERLRKGERLTLNKQQRAVLFDRLLRLQVLPFELGDSLHMTSKSANEICDEVERVLG